MLADWAGWIAPAATMIAAVMTAANLGARITGFGFIVFTVGSLCWSVVGLTTDQANLLWTNGFLTIVNVAGVWRWLGRNARFEDAGAHATKRSAARATPTLLAASSIAGGCLTTRDGENIGEIVEAMLRSDDGALDYVVVSVGGVGGVGATLHAVSAADLSIGSDGVTTRLGNAAVTALPDISGGAWPAAAPRPAN